MDLLILTIYHHDLNHANTTNKQIASFKRVLRHVNPSKSSYDERTILYKRSEISGAMLAPPHPLKCSTIIRVNRSVDNAFSMRLHFILGHLNSSETYVHILFGSVFDSIIPSSYQSLIPSSQEDKRDKLTSCSPSTNDHLRWPICETSKVCRWHNHLPDSGPRCTQIGRQGKATWSGNLLKTTEISGFQDEPAHPQLHHNPQHNSV